MKDFLEMKNTITESKSPMGGVSSRLDEAAARTSPHPDARFLFLHIFASTRGWS